MKMAKKKPSNEVAREVYLIERVDGRKRGEAREVGAVGGACSSQLPLR